LVRRTGGGYAELRQFGQFRDPAVQLDRGNDLDLVLVRRTHCGAGADVHVTGDCADLHRCVVNGPADPVRWSWK
jgi:hypothetical protein